ncbi:hypothetical protein ACFFMN_23480 [Planobispora siamensis]|uniref:Uncharacterized protein n=2 Tax=Planobispora siamensis TaxID=936338 RepID=A0A8J3WP80_9ACTN|nr:hypothetical protein Psi01_59570 [Planobispora siamensis]
MYRTRYQKTHTPITVTQVPCAADVAPGRTCATCGRTVRRRGAHFPARRGAFGWVEHYADGSTYTVPPGQNPKAA